MKNKIALVTVLYNSEKVLKDFFDSLNLQLFKDFKLFVIDNKSIDNSIQKTKEFSEKVFFETQLIQNDDNYGVAKGNNIGIINALQQEFEYVLLCNNDIVLNDNTILNLYNGLQETNSDIVVPKIFYFDTPKIWCAGGKFKLLPGSIEHFGLAKNDSIKYSKQKKITYSPTCFMLIKSKTFYDVGLMDEKYFAYFDDTDFIYRCIKQKKKKMFFIPNSTLLHKESFCSGGSKSDFKINLYYRNKIYFCKKFSHLSNIIYIINYCYFGLKKIITKDLIYTKILKSLNSGLKFHKEII